MKNPCYKCEKRVVGCHGTCKEHKSFREEKDRQKEKIRAENIATYYEVGRQERLLSRQAKKNLKDGRDRRI